MLVPNSYLRGAHDALKKHLENSPVKQVLGNSLSFGITYVMDRTRTMSEIAPTMIILLQHGAKWDRDDLPLPGMKTPYHIICGSTGDHHELLGLMIKDLGRTLLNAKDIEECTALMCAVQNNNVKCVEMLIANGADTSLKNNEYSLQDRKNFRHIGNGFDIEGTTNHQAYLTGACKRNSVKQIKYLLKQGADPNVNVCEQQYPSVINLAIFKSHVEIIACFIRGGVNINSRSYLTRHRDKGMLLPFEAAVCRNHIYAAQMLLVSGCSRGAHILDYNNIRKLKVNINREMLNLLKNWNVQNNTVLPLRQRCRMAILNHLSPQADQKISELPLPPPLINYLSIPELDDIIKTFNKSRG